MTCLSATPFSGQAQQHRESTAPPYRVDSRMCILRMMRSTSTLLKRVGNAMEVHALSRLAAFNIVYGVIAGESRAIEI